MTSLSVYYRQCLNYLKHLNLNNPGLDLRLLFGHALNLSLEDMILHPDHPLTLDELSQLDGLIARLAQHEPVSKIIGCKAFWKDDFIVNTHVLDPRPESECFIEQALEDFSLHPPEKILDLGTGSGALICSLLKEFPNAYGWAIDSCSQALSVASQNIQALGLASRCDLLLSHWWDKIPPQAFDLIVANPPYISLNDWEQLDPNVRLYDPYCALVADEEGYADYRKIFSQAGNFMHAGSLLFIEAGAGMAARIKALAKEYSLILCHHRCDLSGHVRLLSFQACNFSKESL